MNPMGTTNQKPTIDTQKLERKEHRHTTKEDYQTTKEETKRGMNGELQKQPENKYNKMAISTHLSITTLNVSGLNALIKRHRVADWIKQQDPSICCLQETHFRAKDTHRLKVRG